VKHSSHLISQFTCVYVDIVMHSATKFIAGHSDLMAGILAVKGERCVLCSSFAPNGGTLSLCCPIIKKIPNDSNFDH
jgi:cystathionine beta-lyase/cystathionine gamma-synthase